MGSLCRLYGALASIVLYAIFNLVLVWHLVWSLCRSSSLSMTHYSQHKVDKVRRDLVLITDIWFRKEKSSHQARKSAISPVPGVFGKLSIWSVFQIVLINGFISWNGRTLPRQRALVRGTAHYEQKSHFKTCGLADFLTWFEINFFKTYAIYLYNHVIVTSRCPPWETTTSWPSMS